jgi:hypothetical protein
VFPVFDRAVLFAAPQKAVWSIFVFSDTGWIKVKEEP